MALYTLLPAMKGPREDLLKQALEEMAQHYTHAQLGYRFLWFRRILWRTETMTEEEKLVIEEVLQMQYRYRQEPHA